MSAISDRKSAGGWQRSQWARLVLRRGFILDLAIVAVIGIVAWNCLPGRGPHDARWFLARGVEAAEQDSDVYQRNRLYVELARDEYDAGDKTAAERLLELGWLGLSRPNIS